MAVNCCATCHCFRYFSFAFSLFCLLHLQQLSCCSTVFFHLNLFINILTFLPLHLSYKNRNCPLELATIIATRVASRMSTETTSSGGSELKPALASDSSESALAYSLSSGFTSDQPTDNIDFSYSPRSSGLPSGKRTFLMSLQYHCTPVTSVLQFSTV